MTSSQTRGRMTFLRYVIFYTFGNLALHFTFAEAIENDVNDSILGETLLVLLINALISTFFITIIYSK